MPNWKKVIVSGSDAILNEITSSGGILTSQDIMPDVDNTLSLGSSTQRFQLNGGTPVTVTGSGNANTITRFSNNTEVENSTITNSDTLTTIVHDNDGNDIFIVSGSNGELIKVTDTIGETLFQVNDGSGISHFEVSSSGTLVAQNLEYVDQTFVLTYDSQSGNISFFSSSALIDIPTLDEVTDEGATTTNTISVGGVTVTSMGTGTDNSVVVKNSSNQLVTDEIDSRVWGSSLVDGTNGANNRLATFTDSNSLNGEANLTFDGSTLSVSGDVDSNDVTIDDWGSVSSSLSTLTSDVANIDSNITLQDATNNGQTTSRDIILTNTSASFRNSSGNLSNLEHNKLEFTQGQGAGARSSIWFSSPSNTSSFEINSTPDVYEHGKPDFTIRMHPTSDTVLSSGSFDGLFIDESFTYISHNQIAGISVNDRAITNSTSSALYLYGPDANYNQKKLVLTNITEISSSGNGDSFDVIIKDWGSVSASLATLTSDVAGVSDGAITPIQLTVDCKNLSSGHVPWSALSDLQPNPNRAFTTWIAPADGHLEKVIVSPEQANTTANTARLQFIENGTTTETVSVVMGAAGTNKTFTFTPATTAFSAGDRLSLKWDKLSNTSDVYNMMVVFRLSN